MTVLKPWPHQVASRKFTQQTPIVADFSDPGTGKTRVHVEHFAQDIKRGRMLVVAPKKLLVSAWGKDIEQFAKNLGCTFAYADQRDTAFKLKSDVVAINTDGVKWVADQKPSFLNDFTTLVIDECFPHGTLIDVPGARVDISLLKAGDLVYTSSGILPITETFVRETSSLVKVELEDGTTFRCTPDHPIATNYGWCKARDARGMLVVRLDVHGEQGYSEALLRKELLAQSYVADQNTSRKKCNSIKNWDEQYRPPGMEQRHSVAGRLQKPFEQSSKSPWAKAFRTWRQRQDCTRRSLSDEDAPSTFQIQFCDTYKPFAWQRLSTLLQSRFRRSADTSSDRGRRFIAQCAKALRREEGQIAHFTRVARVSHIKCRSPVEVFNFRVDGPHDYSVAGVLVHNSSYFKHPSSQRSKAMRKISKLKGLLYKTIMSGTPNANSVMELWHQILLLDGGKRLGDSYYKLRSQVQSCEQVGPSANHLKWTDTPGIEPVVYELIKDIVIRHKFEDVMTHVPANHVARYPFELSKRAKKMYDELETHAWIALQDANISAVHAASLRTKLLQIACIKRDTLVLSEAGWLPIQDIPSTLRVWDGVEWVSHQGAVLKGTERVIKCHGVWMTPEHPVLTEEGWVCGESSEKFARAKVRLPNCCVSRRHDHEHGDTVRYVDVPMRMRQHGRAPESISPSRTSSASSQLWMSKRQQKTRHDRYDPILQMVRNARSLPQSWLQGLQELGCAWHHSVRALAQFVRSILVRYGAKLQTGIIAGANRQQQRLQSEELSLGNSQAAKQQHTQQYLRRDAQRPYDNCASSRSVRHSEGHATCSDTPIRLDSEKRFEPVYDLVNCGPRSRFVAQDESGQPLIVHNSGAVYDDRGGYQVIDRQRYELVAELVEERQHSIVFFNWKHQREELKAEFAKRGIEFAIIDGSVSERESAQLVDKFQEGRLQAMAMHYKTGSHGLTLTRGQAAIWSSPVYEADYFKQGNHRIYRGSQKYATNTLCVEALGTVEQIVFDRLTDKLERMDDFLTLMECKRGKR